jgi:hypothetical protein
LRLEVLFTACLRWPLEVAIGKAVWRYYHRLSTMLGEGQRTPIVELARWAVA